MSQVPQRTIEDMASLKFPPSTDRRLQHLMERNNQGNITTEEREELEAMAELSERMSLIRADALHLLGRQPQ